MSVQQTINFDQAIQARDRAMERVERKSGKEFQDAAKAFIVDYLDDNGPSSGEAITNACKAAGITPHDDRAFGPALYNLAKDHLIAKCGSCKRTKGHGTAGGNVWRLKK